MLKRVRYARLPIWPGETGWWESFNYAIGSSVEPGSTFKTATMLASLEDGVIKLEDSININHGKAQFFESFMVDSSPESTGLDTISIQKAFEISSNVGIAGLAALLWFREWPRPIYSAAQAVQPAFAFGH